MNSCELTMSPAPSWLDSSVHRATYNFIMTRIFTILQKYIHIKLKKLDNSNSANPQVAWANLGGPHLFLDRPLMHQ